MTRRSKLLWDNVRKIVNGGAHASTTLSVLTGRFPFPRDVERADSRLTDYKVFRSPSRTGSVATSSREYIVLSSADQLNPFADFLADDAKVWSMYLDSTKSKGEELMRIWNSDLDTILIFAGLFSAILTAFLIETRKNLQQDTQVITNMLLEQVIQHLSPNSPPSVPTSSKFVPSSPLVWVNGLWFVSLTFSLAGAFGTILAKGWVSQFIPVSAGLPIVDACNRHRRFFGDDQRHLRTVIAALPITLHVGFYLFFGGLVILLFQDDSRIAVVVTALIAVTMLLYLGCSVRPILNPNSPFRTPISGLLPVIPGFLIPLALLGDAIGHVLFPPRERRYKARRLIYSGTYTKLEAFCLYMTSVRRLWTNNIQCTITSLYRLMLVSEPPSDELRTDVLVGLFSLARSHNLDDPVCALAALPITPRLQETLYITDPLPALTRNIAELFSSPKKLENPEVAQAYLTVLLSLVQTSHSSLNWTANSLVPLLERGGILSNWDSYEGDILELIICIHIHVRIRSGFLLPANFTNRIPDVITNCTKPLHRQWLIEGCLALSVMDQGVTLKRILKNEHMHPILFGPILGTTLSQMIVNPQKRVQRSVLSAISAIAIHEAGCAALIHQNILGLLLDHIPGSNAQFQCEALHIFAVFLQHEGNDNVIDENQDVIFEQEMLRPWIESMFNLFLAAMLKSEQLNVQEAAVAILSRYLHHDFPRTEFLRLDHSSALLTMLETDESSLQIAAIEILSVLISYDDTRSTINHHEFGRAIGLAMLQSTSQTAVHRYILDLVLERLNHDDLRRVLVYHIKVPLIQLFKYGNAMSEFTDKLFSLLYAISCNNSICQHLLDTNIIFFLLNTITNDQSFNHWSIEITFQTLMNILNQNNDSLNFSTEIVNDAKKTSVSTDIIETITHLLERGSPSSQIRAMNILVNASRYFDLRQHLSNSRVIPLLIQRLDLGNSAVKKASLNTLLKLIEYDHIRPTIIQPSIVSSLLTIIWRDWTELSEPSLMLLTLCMAHSKNPIILLPPASPQILRDLLNSHNNHGPVAALTIISECTKVSFLKDYDTIMKFLSTEILMKVTEIFCSTNELVIQEKATDTLYDIINHDQLRPVIVKELFVSTILHASTNSDITFQSTALDIIYAFAQHEETPLSKPEYLNMLLDNLKTCDYQAQTLIIKIIWQIAQTGDGRNSIILHNVLDRILHLGTSPDTNVSITVMRVIELLFIYDDLRQEIDVTILVQLITYVLHTSDAQLHAAVCHTFENFMKYRDVHEKVIHPDIIRPIHRSLYQCTSPLTLNFTLRSTQRYYFSRILQIIQDADQSAFQKIVQDHFPPTAPFENQIATEHQVLAFPDEMDSRRSEYSIIDDTDSSFMHIIDREENYSVG